MEPVAPSPASDKSPPKSPQKSEENVPIKLPPADFNHRQRWFLAQLHEGVEITAVGISARWAVTIKTARRDIAGLQAGLVVFKGARKSGRYELSGGNTSLLQES